MNLNWASPLNSLSYGYSALHFLRALTALGHKVALFPISQVEVTSQADADLVNQLQQNAQYFDKDAPCVRLYHQFDMAQFAGSGPHIGFPIFELDTFNALEKHHLSSVDKLFVCSEWAKGVCLNNGLNNIEVVPLGVDRSIFSETNPSRPPTNPTVFFNCGKWEVRKGHDILIEAFDNAFTDENVELWMMCTNVFNSEKENRYWIDKYAHSKVRIIPRVQTQADVYNVMRQIDCGVFPSRAEGWNLEALELLACGKHLIITDYSAHTEYCIKENADLITIEETEPAFDGKWFFGQGSWAKIGSEQVDQLVEYMRAFHKKRVEGGDTYNYNGIKTSQQFTWENSARKLISSL